MKMDELKIFKISGLIWILNLMKIMIEILKMIKQLIKYLLKGL
jgi:hypothetical protein